MVKQRIADAQKAAEALVERERHAAEADAEEQRQQVQAEVDQEVQEAQADAEDCRQRAEELDRGRDRETRGGPPARRRGRGSRSCRRRGSQPPGAVTGERSPAAGHDAEAQVKATERLRERTRTTAKRTARELESDDGGLESHSKPELVQLAASVGIESRTNMTKSELVDAIAKASRTAR